MSQGVVAGLFAGIIFSFFLIIGGIGVPLGNIIGMPTELGTIIVHLMINVLAGLIFVMVFNRFIHSWAIAGALGFLFGLALWAIGSMTFLPSLSAGEPLFSKWNEIGLQANRYLLMGHMVYGLSLGLSYCFLKKGKLHKLKKLDHNHASHPHHSRRV